MTEFMADHPDKDKEMARLDAALQTLSEHFDTCHIFCTRHESGELDGTLHLSKGTGNWYARLGQIHEWLIAEMEATRLKVRREGE